MDGVKATSFEASALRYVHDVLTGEFVTVGIVLVCPERSFIGCRVTSSLSRVRKVFPDADLAHFRRVCSGIESACEEWQDGLATAPPLDGVPPLPKLLRMLVPPEDAAIQFSPVTMSGITRDPARTLEELFERYTGDSAEAPARRSRGEQDVWKAFTERVQDRSLLRQLKPREVATARYSWVFDHAWKNGIWNAVQPVSLDLLEPKYVREKALTWSARIDELRPLDQGVSVKLLVAFPGATHSQRVRDAARDGIAMLQEKVGDQAQLVREADGDRLAEKIAADLAQHHA